MEIPIIKIGNSKGIILSKVLLDRYGMGNKLELIMKENHLELKALKSVREGWDEKFQEMHEHGDDRLLMDELSEDEELDEWK
jgi:antitoxin MazE